MPKIKYTKYTPSLLDDLSIEDLLDSLSDFLLQSGYQYGFEDATRPLAWARGAAGTLVALVSGAAVSLLGDPTTITLAASACGLLGVAIGAALAECTWREIARTLMAVAVVVLIASLGAWISLVVVAAAAVAAVALKNHLSSRLWALDLRALAALRRGAVGAFAPLIVAVVALAVTVATSTMPEGGLSLLTVLSPTFWLGLATCGWIFRSNRHDAALSLAGLLAFMAFHARILGVGPVGIEAVAILALALLANSAYGRFDRATMRFGWLHLIGILGALSTALTALIQVGRFPTDLDFVAWATWQSPVLLVGGALTALVIGAAFIARRGQGQLFHPTSLLSPLQGLAQPQILFVALSICITWTLSGVLSQLLLESGLTATDFLLAKAPRTAEAFILRNQGSVIAGLMVLAALLITSLSAGVVKKSAGAGFALVVGAALAVGAIMISALARKWIQLEPAVQGPEAEPFLAYLFWGSRRTKLLYVLLLGLGALAVIPRFGRIAARVRTRRASVELAVIGTLLVIAGLVAMAWAPRRVGLLIVGLGVAALGFVAIVWQTERLLALGERLRSPAGALSAATLTLGICLTGWLGGAVGLAATAMAIIAVSVGRSPLTNPEVATGNGALVSRGAVHLALASLAAIVPAGVLNLLGHAGTGVVMHTIGVYLVLLLVWCVVVNMRLSLGVADVLERVSPIGPAAALFALLGMVDLMVGAWATADPIVPMVAAGAAALAALVINFLLRFSPLSRLLELLERPNVFVPILAVAVMGFTLVYNHKLVTAFSFHVSQKHILQTVADAEDGDFDGKLLQHGIGGQSARNFYTKDIPEVKDPAAALDALAGNKDVVLPQTLAGSSATRYQLARGWSDKNDANGDGVRDHQSDGGVARAADPKAGWLEDPTKTWSADQWSGFTLIDSDGWRFRIVGNTANRVTYDATTAEAPPSLKGAKRSRTAPAFDANLPTKSRYIIDWAEAADHTASAMAASRLYFLLPKIGSHAPGYQDKGSFSDLNHRFRKLSGGRHLAVLDDRSSQILLATSFLRSGETDHNWIADNTLDDEAFLALVKDGQMRGYAREKPLSGVINWEDKLLLLGWRMDDFAVSKGKKLRIYSYYKVKSAISTSLKMFMHLDRSGHRIHSDHWPLAVSEGDKGKHCIGCFQTNHWMEGDIVVDVLEREVPLGAPSGETDINMGFFNPQDDKRFKITSWNDKIVQYGGSDNRVRIGGFVVR